MKRKIVSKMLALSIAMATVATSGAGYAMAVPVLAAETDDGISLMNAGDYTVNNGTLDFGQGTARITIVGNDEQSLVGKRFEIFRLFDAENSAGGESINYTFNAKYQEALKSVVAEKLNERDGSQLVPSQVTEYMVIDYIQTLNTNEVEGATADQVLEGRYSSFRYFVEDVRDEIKDMGITGDYVYVNGTTSTNTITLSGLQYGYYIIDEITEQAGDGSDWFASSLCMVDTANPTAEINIKSDYPDDPDDGIEKVVQEDDTDEWGNSADFEIGQTIPYQVTTEIPDINGYETYYYAWHDQMSESLTFHADKSDISIVISDGSKNYILTSGEYNVLTSGAQLDEGDTFVIEVQDIKRIVDREFSKENNLGENDYTGITVTLQYEATLNDNAVDETGSQGIGNSVRLEYSNDPETDSTGYTPFDTTTSYTFVLNANKVNNHDRVLADAKFRLYADEDCTQEVYVKPADGVGGNSYIVINRDSLGGNDHTGGTTPGNAVEMVSDANGDFTIYGLDTGTYYLKETDAPAGYRQLLDPITITIDAEYNDEALQSMSANASIISFYDGAYSTDNVQLNTDLAAGSADIQIVNEVGTRLPITGSNAMLIMLGAGVVLVGGAAFVYKRHKKATED